VGRDTTATGFLLEADLLELTPVTKMLPHSGVSVGNPNTMRSDAEISLYPNPARTGVLFVQITPGSGNAKADVELVDVLGRVIAFESDVPILQDGGLVKFDVHKFPAGNYIARVTIHSDTTVQHLFRTVQIRE